jgi:hypothetical protein
MDYSVTIKQFTKTQCGKDGITYHFFPCEIKKGKEELFSAELIHPNYEQAIENGWSLVYSFIDNDLKNKKLDNIEFDNFTNVTFNGENSKINNNSSYFNRNAAFGNSEEFERFKASRK